MLNAWKEEIKVQIRSEISSICKKIEETNNTLKNHDQRIDSTKNKVDTMKKQLKFKNLIMFGLLEKEIDMDSLENNVIELINNQIFKECR